MRGYVRLRAEVQGSDRPTGRWNIAAPLAGAHTDNIAMPR
jgi:hypothetical protein